MCYGWSRDEQDKKKRMRYIWKEGEEFGMVC